jgi:hypothetical protein
VEISVSGRGSGKPRKDLDGRRLAGSVWAQISEELSRVHMEIDTSQRMNGLVVFSQSFDSDHLFFTSSGLDVLRRTLTKRNAGSREPHDGLTSSRSMSAKAESQIGTTF